MKDAYKLDPKRHESIYSKIANRYLPKSKPQEQPCAIITGGQPGSGKSGITAQTIRHFKESGYVLVDADKLRSFHPDYMHLMRKDDKIAANLTHPDAGPWATRLLRDGVEGRRNIIIDQTSRDPVALTKIAQGLKQAGYTVELHVMAVSPAVSEQRIYQRYEELRAKDGFGRFSTKDKHDEAYVGVADTVASVEKSKQIDRLCLYDHGAKPIYDNRLENGQWVKEPQARSVMEAERNRPMSLQERRDYAQGFDKLAELLSKRQASPEEVQKIDGLRQQARAMLAAEVFRQEPPEKAVQKHPELAGAAAVLTAIDKKAEADGRNEQQRAVAMARARQNAANSIERGELPEVKIREERQIKIEPTQRDPER